MASSKQKGFTVIEIVLGISLIGIIGVATYFAYHNHQQTNKPAATVIATPAGNFFAVSDWHVRLKLTGTLVNLTPSTTITTGYNASDQDVIIYAPELDASWTCVAVDGHKGLIGSITRTAQAKRAGPYEPLVTKKIEAYTYGFEATETSNCTTSPKYQELVTSFKTAFQDLQTY